MKKQYLIYFLVFLLIGSINLVSASDVRKLTAGNITLDGYASWGSGCGSASDCTSATSAIGNYIGCGAMTCQFGGFITTYIDVPANSNIESAILSVYLDSTGGMGPPGNTYITNMTSAEYQPLTTCPSDPGPPGPNQEAEQSVLFGKGMSPLVNMDTVAKWYNFTINATGIVNLNNSMKKNFTMGFAVVDTFATCNGLQGIIGAVEGANDPALYITYSTAGGGAVTEAPSINFTTPANNTFTTNTTLNITANIVNGTTPTANVSLYVYNETSLFANYNWTDGTWYNVLFGYVVNFVDGVYNYFYTARSQGGLTNSTANITLTIDTTAPSIQITYPLNTTYYSDVTQITNVVGGGQACWYSLDLGANNASFTCGNNIVGLNADRGSNTWTIWTNDSLNNIASNSTTFNYVIQGEVGQILRGIRVINDTTSENRLLWAIDSNGNEYHTSANGTLWRCYIANDGTQTCI